MWSCEAAVNLGNILAAWCHDITITRLFSISDGTTHGHPADWTDEDHRAALAAIEACWGAPEGTEEGDKLDVLTALVEIYEAKRWPIDVSASFDPIDVLHYALAELGHTQAELAELLGSRSRASEILARRRALTVEMIHRISEAWKIPADLLVRPYKIERAA